jgi:CubicO group peptidase (beta-lactamase class C family)
MSIRRNRHPVEAVVSTWCPYVAVISMLLAPMTLSAQADEQRAAQIMSARNLVQEFMSQNAVPGLTAAVGSGGEVVWSEAFGFADLDDSLPVTPATRFRIGSISMSLTAAGIALLVERKKLELGASIQYYVPSFPEKRYEVTLQHLAGHLAGIRHYRGDEFYATKHYESVLEGLSIFARDTLESEPGTRFSFSTYGWSLLSAAVEAAAGEDFLSYMTLSVFEPLGLVNTVADRSDARIEGRAHFYQLDEAGHPVEAPFVDNSHKWAGGGFLSTAEDLVRFGLAHMTPGFLQEQAIERLWTSQRTNQGIETGYGIGWAVGVDRSGRRVVSHTGSSVGARAILLVYPDEGVVVALAANLSGLAFRELPQGIALLFMQ